VATVSSRNRRPRRRRGGAMAELKTSRTDVAVRDHLATIEDDGRRADCSARPGRRRLSLGVTPPHPRTPPDPR